jgi:NitT/TauT family transport system permease protein
MGLGQWRTFHAILVGLRFTTYVCLLGFVIAAGLGVGFAVLMVQGRWVERMIFPYAVVLQTVPVLALVPLIGIWWGFGFRSRLVVCVLIAVFPIVTNTLFGLKSADAAQQDLFTLHGAGRWTRLWKLQLPGALPAIFTGFRISAGLAVIGAVVGEFFFQAGGTEGLGQLITTYQLRQETDRLITAIILACALGIAMFSVISWLGGRVTGKWSPVTRPTRPSLKIVNRPTPSVIGTIAAGPSGNPVNGRGET